MSETESDAECTYCGSDVFEHDPVFLEELADEKDGDRAPAGRFCNYACLQAHVDEANLVDGAACSWNP